MADTVRKVIKGEAGWGDLIWAALDCIPATKGFTSIAKLGKLWKAGGLRALGGGALHGIGGGLKNTANTLRRAGRIADPGLYRRTVNLGAFKALAAPMQLRTVRQAAREGGVGLSGVRIRIDRNPDLIGKNLFGYTHPKGTITLYPDAFTDMETLVATVGHERMHVMQFRIHGPVANNADGMLRENACYETEQSFVDYYRSGGRPG